MDFFKGFKVNFIHHCNKLLALGNWIRHRLKDQLRNSINTMMNVEELLHHLIICFVVIINIDSDHQWFIRCLVVSNNLHYNKLNCMPMLALIGIVIYFFASMISLIY